MNVSFKIFFPALLFLKVYSGYSQGDSVTLNLANFLERATTRDSNFQEILFDELRQKYALSLSLPVQDLILNIKGEYAVALDGTQQPVIEGSLEKYFPWSGSYFEAGYSNRYSRTSGRINDASLEVGVDVARNAFGKSNKLLSQIVGLENEIANFQIVEAYEDYLSRLLTHFYNWVAAYANWQVAKEAVVEGEKLLENINKKKANYIAYQVDVDKAEYQLLGKRERHLNAKKEYDSQSLKIISAIRGEQGKILIPDTLNMHSSLNPDSNWNFSMFLDSTRTGKILKLLSKKDTVLLERAKDDLLPSLRPYAGIGINDGQPGLLESSKLFLGLNLDLNFDRTKEKANLELIKLDDQKRKLQTSNAYNDWKTRLKDLLVKIESQKLAVELANKKLSLSESIHKAETTEYLYGRTDINDLIQALNNLQINRFDKINAEIELDVLILEWQRLSDGLVTKNLKSLSKR